MVKTSVDTNEGHTFEYNSNGAIIIAIKAVRESGEMNDIGFGLYGRFSVVEAIESIVACTKEMFKSYAEKGFGMNLWEMEKLFRAEVEAQFPGTDGITLTFNADINQEALEAITGGALERENPAKNVQSEGDENRTNRC